MSPHSHRMTAFCLALLLPLTCVGQQTMPAEPPAASSSGTAGVSSQPEPTKPSRARDRKRALKLYIKASDLFQQGQFEQALQTYEQAAQLVPTNSDYTLAVQVARSHVVTALIQTAAKARIQGDTRAARAALQRARMLDPTNAQVAEHADDLADDATHTIQKPLYEEASQELGETPRLIPLPGVQSFHFRTDRRQLIQRIYKAYGINATLDQSVPAQFVQFDLDDATFAQAVQVLAQATDTFAVPLDPHRVIVARDTKLYRQQFQRLETETLYLPGFVEADLTEVSNIAKNVFGVSQVSTSENHGTVTVRATPETLDAFNVTMQGLTEGRSQVMLDVQILQLAHTASRDTGVKLPQDVTAFNLYAEEQSILNANQDLVQEIISSGLASANDPLAILGILIASGSVSSSLFENGIATFGGGLTWTGVSPDSTKFQLALNSSDTRALDNVRLRLADGQDETVRSGMRYPILVASYSDIGSTSIAGLTSSGTSSSLTSLLSSLTSSSSTATIPQVQYQDIGLTLRATPKVMRSGDVALTMDLKITALSGSSSNDIPILNNRSYSGVITLKEGHGVLLLSELDKSESRALSGTPGLTEIPGLSNVTDKTVEKDYATLIIVLTPHLIEGPHWMGHSPMLRIARSDAAQ